MISIKNFISAVRWRFTGKGKNPLNGYAEYTFSEGKLPL